MRKTLKSPRDLWGMNKIQIIFIAAFIGLLILYFPYISTRVTNEFVEKAVEDSPGFAPNGTYPLLLLHGFNPTYTKRVAEYSLYELQKELVTDLSYRDAGILISSTTCAQLQYTEHPIIVRASYFENELLEIEDYSQNVALIIDKLLYCTGAEKVDVITHSMGGIVARNYIKNFENATIRKLIMIATPNHGQLYTIGNVADKLVKDGESQIPLDFIALSEDHDFMRSLNEADETLGDIEYYTMAGNIDGKGDGLVHFESVPLNGSSHAVVECFHVSLKNPRLCPEAYIFVKDALSN